MLKYLLYDFKLMGYKLWVWEKQYSGMTQFHLKTEQEINVFRYMNIKDTIWNKILYCNILVNVIQVLKQLYLKWKRTLT